MNKKKSFNDLSSLKSLLEEEYPDYVSEKEINKNEDLPVAEELEAHFSKKGRGGKIVTVIKGFEEGDKNIKVLAKEIKNHLGVGGSVKNGEIIIQGNNRDKIIDYLKSKSYKVKKIGG